MRGVFARLIYIFDNKYILKANGRYDGSSRFAKGQRFGLFPSYSAAWVASKEQFMESLNEAAKLSNLKLKVSYGALGNQGFSYGNAGDLGYYASMSEMALINQIGPFIDGSRPQGIQTPGYAAPGNLTWEKTRSLTWGVELGFFDDRLDLSADIYTRYTEGMITGMMELPSVFGASTPGGNVADLKNKGWEINLGWRDNVSLAGSPFSYSVRLMLWDSRSWITKFDNEDKVISSHYAGKEIGEMWGIHHPRKAPTQEAAR
ncbi:MAG: TonB-dependent receptor [Tannerella sp.]|jgi:hypothetical protein|nr:TonB-dependent receptor [Tannerella sp.]